jgi:O-antigen/teichoic acid export membrane protein
VTARYSLIAGAAIAVVMAANPADVLGLVYKSDFVANGAGGLPFLALGTVSFSLIAIAGTILNGAGRTRTASVITAIALAAAFIGNYIAIPMAAGSGHVLTVAAAVTGGMMTLGAVISGVVLYRQFGGFIPLLSVVRVGIAVAISIAVGHAIPFHGKVMTLVEAVIIGVVFLASLFALREIDGKDLERIRAIRRKRA